eukprot:258613-Lingulodinium_polyedra.AAC.1
MAAQQLNLQVGEEMDFYRQPSSKDVCGWYGPAEVIDATRATRGIGHGSADTTHSTALTFL